MKTEHLCRPARHRPQRQADRRLSRENLKAALTEATFADVVKLNNYFIDMKYLPIFREVRDAYLHTAAPPASTTLAVASFAREGALLEVEAVAVLPPK